MSPRTGCCSSGHDPISQVALYSTVSRPIGNVTHSGPERTAKATPHHWPNASWKRSAWPTAWTMEGGQEGMVLRAATGLQYSVVFALVNIGFEGLGS